MFTETLNSTSRNEETMELENSIEDPDGDNAMFPPLPSDIELPSYANTPDPYDNRYHTVDLFYCPSPPLPSPPPPPPPTSAATLARMYANARTFSSIRTHDSINQPSVSFATQHKKKVRAPIASLMEGVYVNIPVLPPPLPPTPPPKSGSISNEVTYATLLNTTSMVPSIYSDLTINHVEYQQIELQHQSDEINHHRIYENIKSRRPPPLPFHSQQSPSWSIIPFEIDKSLSPSKLTNNHIIPSSSAHIYVNLQYHEDKPPAIPTRTSKSIPMIIQTSPPPPMLPPRNRQKKETHFSSSSVATSLIETEPDEGDMNAAETSSNASTVQVSSIIFFKMFIDLTFLDGKRT
jgi:hypothetical protein